MGPNGLSPTLKARLQELYEKDFLKEEDVDQRQDLMECFSEKNEKRGGGNEFHMGKKQKKM